MPQCVKDTTKQKEKVIAFIFNNCSPLFSGKKSVDLLKGYY